MPEKQIFDTIAKTLAQYEVASAFPYYITSGKPLSYFPKETFGLDYYTVAVCLGGSAFLELNRKPFQLQSNSVLFAAPSTVIQFKNVSADFQVKLLFFEKNFLLKNVADPFLIERMGFFTNQSANVLDIEEDAVSRLLRVFSIIEEKTQQNSKFKDDFIRTSIFLLLLEAGDLLPDEEVTSQDLFFKFSELVKKHIPTELQLSFYQEQLHVSDKYLIEKVKKASGKTPHEIIDEMMIKQACVYLNSPLLNITDIAYKLNFSSVSTFSRFFKKQTGISPTNYKKDLGI